MGAHREVGSRGNRGSDRYSGNWRILDGHYGSGGWWKGDPWCAEGHILDQHKHAAAVAARDASVLQARACISILSNRRALYSLQTLCLLHSSQSQPATVATITEI